MPEPIYDVVGPQPPEHPFALKLAQLMRSLGKGLDEAPAYLSGGGFMPYQPIPKERFDKVPTPIERDEPGLLSSVVVGDRPEALERIAYGRPLTKGRGMTFNLQPGLADIAFDVAGGAGALTRLPRAAAPAVAKGLRAAGKPKPDDWAGFDVQPAPGSQQTIPGVEPLTRSQQTAQDVADLRRREADFPPQPDPPEYTPEDALRVRSQGEAIARLLRERPRGPEPTSDALRREEQLLNLKLDAPESAWPRRQPQGHVVERQQDIVETLRTLNREGQRQREAAAAQTLIDQLRGKRDTPNETIEDALRREGDILRLKTTGGGYSRDAAEVRRQMDTVRELRRAAIFKANEMTPDTRPGPIPNWAEQLTELPTTRGIERGGVAPAGQDWWNQQFNIDPDRPASVGAFLRNVREVPEAFQYGTNPKGLRSLEDYAEEFGKRGKERIDVDWGSNADDYDEPYKIEYEKTHGRGELMRDRHGDYKYSDEPKVHEWGDKPMYDQFGNVKKKELMGPVRPDDEPLLVKKRAQGGEVKRDEYGNEKYPLAESEGGEVKRDERGNIKYGEKENPDYNPPEDNELTLSTRHGRITASDYGSGDEALMGALEGGKSGALLYQTLLAHASKTGDQIGVSGLTPDNQLRILSNALSNYARTGVNPRDVSGTLSGRRKHATYGPEGKERFAEGPDIWRGETGEAERRIAEWGGDPNRVQFDGKQFLDNGKPITPSELVERMDEIAPGFKSKGHKAGPKTVMRAAVYRWLEGATPEQAAEVAKGWGKVGGPLFSFAGASALLASKLRADARDDTQ